MHLLQSLRTAASQLHMNVIISEQSMQDVMFGMMDNVVMLDEQALPVYAGAPNKASSLHGVWARLYKQAQTS